MKPEVSGFTDSDAPVSHHRDAFRNMLYKVLGIDPRWRERKPKALFVSSDCNRMSGAFLSLVRLNTELNQSFGEQTKVILPYYGSGIPIIKEAGVSHEVIPSQDWIVPIGTKKNLVFRIAKYAEHTRNMSAAIRIAKEAIKGNYNLIHSNTTYTYVGMLAAKYAHLPHAWHLREHLRDDQDKEIYCEAYGKRLISGSDRVITISNVIRDRYKEIVKSDKLRTIYNGIDPQKYNCPGKRIFQSDPPVLLFAAGSDSPNKGRADLIDACSRLKAKGKRFSLWFVGWCNAELLNMVKKAGLSDCTKFFGYQKEMERFYSKADIFFMCSKFEAFGRTTVEAMMSGCLVIGAKTGGTIELIQDGITGLFYQWNNGESLEKKICYALDNKEEMQRVALRGKQFAHREMTSYNNAKNIYALHTEMMQTIKPPNRLERFGAKLELKARRLYCAGRRYMILPFLKLFSPRGTSQSSAMSDACYDGPKVSVIVPIYNVKDYLRQCLDSIISQSLRDIEIICVNDGSDDGSEQIVKEYAEKDPRIILINKENSGYGASVNRGLDVAGGEYVGIVESDDFIEKDMYKTLYRLAKSNGTADIVKGSYWMYYDTEDKIGKRIIPPINNACKQPRTGFDVWSYPEILYHHPSIWSCVYRREFLNINNIRMVEAKGAGWVDNPFLIQTFCLAKTISWTPDPFYNYRQTNPNASSFVKDCSMPFHRTSEMLRFLDDNGIWDDGIRGSVYKRILYNTDAALQNPNYKPEKDNPLIFEQIIRVPPAFLQQKRVKESEREAYDYFMSIYKGVNSAKKTPLRDGQEAERKTGKIDSQPKVSVIMPSLNVGPYIRKCMESVVNQTLQEIEIICVDAGSTDGTLEVLQEYAGRDPRIRLIHSDEKSYGYQMNLGLDAAKGEYIGVVETDDFAERNMLAGLYKTAKKYGAEFVRSNYYRYVSTGDTHDTFVDNSCGLTYKKLFSPRNYYRIFNMVPAIWTGIYQRNWLQDCSIRFLETPGASYQDTGFILKVLCCADKAVLLPDAYLHYRTDNSNSSVKSKEKAFCVCDEYASVHQFLDTRGEQDAAVRKAVWARQAEAYRWNYQRISDEYRLGFLRKTKEDFEKAQEAGALDPSFFSEKNWDAIQQIMESPEHYFLNESKRIISALKVDIANIRASRSYRIGRAVTWLPRKLRDGVRCLREHGFRFTIRRFGEKLRRR